MEAVSGTIIGLWILAVAGVVLIAEIIAGRHRGIHKKHDVLTNVICFVGGAAVRPVTSVVLALAISAILPAGKEALVGIPFLVALPLIVVAAEFVNYWVHRLSHQLKDSAGFDWLWRMHRTHHTAPYVNVLLNFRISIFWALVSGLNWVFALAIYFGQLEAAGAAIIMFSLWGIVTHSHFRWDDAIRSHPLSGRVFRAFEHIFVSPGLHHSHHGYGKDGGNYRNFGVFLSVFDWIFGTLHIPKGRPAKYGIPGRQPHWADDAFAPFKPAAALQVLTRQKAKKHQ